MTEASSSDCLNDMRFGAVCIMDALGFKGIWRRRSVPDTLQTLAHLKDTGGRHMEKGQECADMLSLYFGDLVAPDLRLRMFSDTIIVTATVGKPGEEPDPWGIEYTLAVVAGASQNLIAAAAKDPNPIAFRGCIAVGQLCMDGEFLIGPAVDEAAEWHEQADAAVVWLTPSALIAKEHHDMTDFRSLQGLTFEWDVPLKRARSFRTLVANPHPLEDEVERKLLASFGDTMETAVKRQQTQRLLEAGRGHWRAYANELKDDDV
jgi:hypothetical protein